MHLVNRQDDTPRPRASWVGVLDEVLCEYLRRADRMGWSPYDLVDLLTTIERVLSE